jgi:hypothetical protein
MAMTSFCVNKNCSCPVGDTGDACCADCEQDASGALPGACGCGHSDCEPKGLELESELSDAVLA